MAIPKNPVRALLFILGGFKMNSHFDEAFDRMVNGEGSDMGGTVGKLTLSKSGVERQNLSIKRKLNKECLLCGTKLIPNRYNVTYCPNVLCIVGLSKTIADLYY